LWNTKTQQTAQHYKVAHLFTAETSWIEQKGRGRRCTSGRAQAVTVPSLWRDGQTPTSHRTSP